MIHPGILAARPRRTYAKWVKAVSNTYTTLSNGDLTATRLTVAPFESNSWRNVWSSVSKTSGKWYWELTINVGPAAGGTSRHCHGYYIQNAVDPPDPSFPGQNSVSYGYLEANGNKINNNTGVAFGTAYTTGDILNFAVDVSAGKLWFGKNGTWQASGDPVAGTNPAYTFTAGTRMLALAGMFYSNSSAPAPGAQVTANFGATAFSHTVPTGFNPGLYQG